jgi:hypothetical protein
MAEKKRDRRRIPSDLKSRPPSSPANFLILVVVGVLGATAVAAALFGTGVEETTPHGQVLTSLQRVAEAQEEHYRRTGTFGEWLHTLDVEVPGEVRVAVLRGDRLSWKVTAAHPVGLTCIQEGHARQGRPAREPPVCYNTAE